jgi:hypothetical protein
MSAAGELPSLPGPPPSVIQVADAAFRIQARHSSFSAVAPVKVTVAAGCHGLGLVPPGGGRRARESRAESPGPAHCRGPGPGTVGATDRHGPGGAAETPLAAGCQWHVHCRRVLQSVTVPVTVTQAHRRFGLGRASARKRRPSETERPGPQAQSPGRNAAAGRAPGPGRAGSRGPAQRRGLTGRRRPLAARSSGRDREGPRNADQGPGPGAAIQVAAARPSNSGIMIIMIKFKFKASSLITGNSLAS